MLNLQQIENDEESVLLGISCILQRTVTSGDSNHANKHAYRQFVGAEIPDIPIASYLNRIKRYLKCSSTCWIAMLVYLDRVLSLSKAREFPVVLDSLSVHRLMIGAALAAAKFNEDSNFSNEYIAQVGGISLQELNRIELLFCNILDWDFNLDVETFEKYYHQLVSHPTLCGGCRALQQATTLLSSSNTLKAEDTTSSSVSPKRERRASLSAELHKSKHPRVRSKNTRFRDRDIIDLAGMCLDRSARLKGKENIPQTAHHNVALAC